MKVIIRGILDVRGWTQADLAKRLRTTQVTVSRWLDGTEPRGLMRDKIRELAEESGLGEAPRENHIIPIMGRVGAGAVVEPEHEQIPEGGLDRIELPYPISEQYVGFEVIGTSMMPKYDAGEILVVRREPPCRIERMLGLYAVVRTEDGRRLVKRIARGSKTNHFNLESANAETIANVRLAWASPVEMVIPNVGLRRRPLGVESSEKIGRSPSKNAP